MDQNTEKLRWIDRPCDWCGSTEVELNFKGPDRLEHLPGEFTIVRCQSCGLYRQNPYLEWDSLKHYYPEDYASHASLVQDQPNLLRRLDKRYGPWKRLRSVEGYQPGGRLLEVGCGTGLFLEEALRSGRWELTGIEPSERAANYVREKLGLTIIQDTFENTELPENYFDVIVMWNVLEHLDQPIESLRRAHRSLKDGGWLIVGIPNLESWEASLFGPTWIGWDLPRHLYLFPRDTLREIYTELGFRWEAIRCLSTSYSVLGHTLDFWSQTWEDKYPILRKILLRTYYSLPGRILMLFPLWISDRLTRSTIITIFAQKQQSR